MMRCFALLTLGAALLAPALVTAAAALPEEAGVTGYSLLRYLHIFLFVFWLGPDFGVYLWSRKGAEPGLPAEQRVAAGQMMVAVSFISRAAMSLMLTVGGLLSEYVGLTHAWWQMAGIVLLGPVWLALVLVAAFRDGTPLGDSAERVDAWLRWLLVVAIPVSVAYAMFSGRLALAPYVGGKLLLFAVALLLGLLLQARLQPFRAGLRQLVAGGDDAATAGRMANSLARSRPYVYGIWAALLLAALVGVWKPGAPVAPATVSGYAEPFAG
jgi:hypothetical protein